MPLFMVERELPGITQDALLSAGLRAKTCCAEITEEGQPVRWIRSFFLLEQSGTRCYFEAQTKDIVEEANHRAKIPFTKVIEVVELTPEIV
jgi:hypothetical protein